MESKNNNSLFILEIFDIIIYIHFYYNISQSFFDLVLSCTVNDVRRMTTHTIFRPIDKNISTKIYSEKR